jgi:hypothetical protein
LIHILDYAVAVTMTAVAVWRLPAVLHGDSHRRALWGCYAGFAAALWLKTPWAVYHLNRGPVIDGSILLKHYVSTIAILAILTFVAESYGKAAGEEVPRHVAISRWIERVAYKTSIAALVLMTVLFFTVVDRRHPSTDFVAQHAGQWGASTYMSIFYLYLGAASAVCGYQWTSAIKRADKHTLRVGLVLMSIAMMIGVAYVIVRLSFMWIAVISPFSTHFDTVFGNLTDLMQIILFFFFAAGASVPAAEAIGTRWNSGRSLWALYPLWHELMTAFPGISFGPPTSRLREIARTTPPLTVRVDRWTQDIADAVEQLRHYAPTCLLDAAEDAAAEHEDAPAAAESLWIRASLIALADGARREWASPPLPPKPIKDTAAEASWLERVQRAYAQFTVQDVRNLLAEAAREGVL